MYLILIALQYSYCILLWLLEGIDIYILEQTQTRQIAFAYSLFFRFSIVVKFCKQYDNQNTLLCA